jgi:hypothetical protein
MPHDGTTPTAGTALQRSCLRFANDLRRSLGEAGYVALLARAFARTEEAHPALKDLRRPGDDDIHFDAIAASADRRGTDDVAAAVAALIASVIEILTRLIGEDMAIRLFDDDAPEPSTPDRDRVP